MKTKLKLIKGDGFRMTNRCNFDGMNGFWGILHGYAMVGSNYCRKKCEFYCGEKKILWWKFVKCSCRFS